MIRKEQVNERVHQLNHGELDWQTHGPDRGGSGRAGQVRMPPQAPPPMLHPHIETSDPRGFVEAAPPPRTVRLVEGTRAATSPTDARFLALEREVAELRAGKSAAGVPAAQAPVPVGSYDPRREMDRMQAEAWRRAKAESAADPDRWTRLGQGGV